jgi:hypothetical protein
VGHDVRVQRGTRFFGLTLATGVKKYRWQMRAADAATPMFAIGYLEIFK